MWAKSISDPVTNTPINDGVIRLIFFTDSHVISGASNTNVCKAVEDCRTWNANMILCLGDGGNDSIGCTKALWYQLRRAGAPIFFAIGNHDEIETVSGIPETAPLREANAWNMQEPFNKAVVLTSGDGSFKLLCLALDTNYYSDTTPLPIPNHADGARIGTLLADPTIQTYRKLGAAQLAWIQATLAMNESDAVLILMHYRANVAVADLAQLGDLVVADGRPALGLYGHDHASTYVRNLLDTEGAVAAQFIKAPALLESGCWTRLALSKGDGVINIDLAELQNYTDPGGWTVDAPFTIGA